MLRRLKFSALPVLAIAAAFAVGGCNSVHNNAFNGSNTTIGSAPYTQGSGKVATETRSLASFHAVTLRNGLTVTLKHGAAASAAVTADDNLVPMIKTRVENGTLTIDVEGSLTTHNSLRVEVTSADVIDAIDQSTGSTLDVEDLTGPALSVSVSTGSTLRAGGKTVTLKLTVGTGSTADLRNVESRTAQVQVNTGSTGVVNVSDVVSGSCSTGSTLKVSGGANLGAVETDAGSTVARD